MMKDNALAQSPPGTAAKGRMLEDSSIGQYHQIMSTSKEAEFTSIGQAQHADMQEHQHRTWATSWSCRQSPYDLKKQNIITYAKSRGEMDAALVKT